MTITLYDLLIGTIYFRTFKDEMSARFCTSREKKNEVTAWWCRDQWFLSESIIGVEARRVLFTSAGFKVINVPAAALCWEWLTNSAFLQSLNIWYVLISVQQKKSHSCRPNPIPHSLLTYNGLKSEHCPPPPPTSIPLCSSAVIAWGVCGPRTPYHPPPPEWKHVSNAVRL